jgi:hypothetical protein
VTSNAKFMIDYNSKVRKKVEGLIEAGTSSFSELCAGCEGVPPLELWNYYSQSLLVKESEKESVYKLFPEPHPVDFDWRFSAETINNLVEQSKSYSKILCVGTPTIFKELISENPETYLIDNNEIICDYFTPNHSDRVVRADLFIDHINMCDFDLVITDPPWYPEHYKVWINRISQVVKNGASIITTLFPRLVRPNAEVEREEIFNIFQNLGEISIVKGGAKYDTPIFELETMMANGIPPIYNWRNADLLFVSNCKKMNLEVTPFPSIPSEWIKIQIKSQIIALKREENQSAKISAKAVYEDGSFILKSVSRRHPNRDTINFWTSRNRCLKVSGIEKIIDFLESIQNNKASLTQQIKSNCESQEEENSLTLITSLIGL